MTLTNVSLTQNTVKMHRGHCGKMRSLLLWENDKMVSVCSHLSVLGYSQEGRGIRRRFLPAGVSPRFSC